MRNSNKLIGAVVLSTALVSSGVAVMANNGAQSDNTSDLMSVLIEPKEDGTSFNLKLKNPSDMTGYFLTLKIYGPVTLNNNCFEIGDNNSSYTLIKTNVDSNSKSIEGGKTTTVKIAVTSDESLLKKSTARLENKDSATILNIGTINIAHAEKGAEYIIDELKFESVSSNDNNVFSTNTIDESSPSTIVLGSVANNEGSNIENPKPPKDDNEGTGGGSDTDEGGSGTDKPNPDPEEKPNPPTKPEEPEKPGDNDNTGGSIGGGTSKPEKPEEEKPEDYNVQLFSMSGKDRYETSTKISKTGWTSGAKNVVIVNGNEKNMVDGLSATPFATIKDAPLLLSNGKTLPASTISELKRLSPTNVYVIGGTASMPESLVSSIKSNTKATVTRIGGSTRYETSLEIAKQIDKIADVNKVYISSGTGEVDALSIASVAGREKAPILLTNVNSIDNKTYDFIRSESIKDAYFIGGDKKISNSVINQVDKVVSADVSKNRVAGRNRKDTNAAIIKKFYTGSKLNGVVVSKDDVIIDALTVGSFAAKNDMPVIIGRESLSTSQKNVLASKNTEKVYQAGGGVKTSVINNLKELLGTKK